MTILMIFFIICIIAIIVVVVQQNKGKKALKEKGFDPSKSVAFGMFVGGHPDINDTIKMGHIIANENMLAICNQYYKPLGEIPKDKIKNILFEDASTFGSRVSAGRMLLVGIFAFAWKKKTKNSQYYVVIEWNDGRFDHSTAFLFEQSKSANVFRNSIIKWAR
jgi:hypothetical protein